MALSKCSIRASIIAEDAVTVSGFGSKTFDPSLSFSRVSNTTTFNTVTLLNTAIAAGANTDLDLYATTTSLGESINTANLIGFLVKVTASATGGVLKIAPSATNPATLGFGASSHNYSLKVGTINACMMICEGVARSMNATIRNVNFENTGSVSINVSFLGVLGT